MSNRVSSFIPLAPQITQANIASQFPKDTIKVPLPEMTHSEKLEKAEFDAKERKELTKKKEAMPGGRFPIRNESDLKNAIKDVPRSSNPAAAKAWVKKRAKDLDCEDCLPGSWEKATEDELNMFDGELKKGKNESNALSEKPEREAHNYDKKVLKTPANKTVANDKPTKVKKSLKKDMDGDGGGDEMEESVNKAFDNIFGEESDQVEKAFENIIGVELDPIEKAFSNLLEKGEGSRGGKVIGHTTSGKPIYSHFGHEGHKSFTRKDHHEAAEHHDSLGEAARSMDNSKKAQFHDKQSIQHFREVTHKK